jgi:hypothetical protein
MIKQLNYLIYQKLILFIRYSTKKNRFTTKNITLYHQFVLKRKIFLCLNEIFSKIFKVFRKNGKNFWWKNVEFLWKDRKFLC